MSGGQTGADCAGLDFAIEAGLGHGGFVPRGCRAEDGRIPERYKLIELSSVSLCGEDQAECPRRRWHGRLQPGADRYRAALLTFEYSTKRKKPRIHIH
jgi:hypothetical protein